MRNGPYEDSPSMAPTASVPCYKSKSLQVPENIELFYIPPYTPEMNPIEQLWKELRKLGFRNEVFATLEKVVDRLCETISRLSSTLIRSITPAVIELLLLLIRD